MDAGQQIRDFALSNLKADRSELQHSGSSYPDGSASMAMGASAIQYKSYMSNAQAHFINQTHVFLIGK